METGKIEFGPSYGPGKHLPNPEILKNAQPVSSFRIMKENEKLKERIKSLEAGIEILRGLDMSVKWELAPEIKANIKTFLNRLDETR